MPSSRSKDLINASVRSIGTPRTPKVLEGTNSSADVSLNYTYISDFVSITELYRNDRKCSSKYIELVLTSTKALGQPPCN